MATNTNPTLVAKVPDFGNLDPKYLTELPEPSTKWCIKQGLTVYRTDANASRSDFSLSKGDIVTVKRIYAPADSDAIWSEFISPTYSKTGWVHDFYLDDYYQGFPDNNDLVRIQNQTKDSGDAKQYMMWPTDAQQDKQKNMCGELCVAYIIRNEIDINTSIEDVLIKWRDAEKTSYDLGKIREGLRIEHLNGILQLYDDLKGKCQIIQNPGAELQESPEQLENHYLIARVTINGKGALIPRADRIAHWVVVEEMTRNGWGLKLYNPFLNKYQEYSLAEFLASCANPGLWVSRKQPKQRIVDLEPFEVTLDTGKPPEYQAEQYIDREGSKKTQLCGEFCTAYILGKSIDRVLEMWRKDPPSELWELTAILRAYGCYRQEKKSFTIGTVLDYWKMTQPQHYKYYVGENKGTGKAVLRSIFRAYGYANDDLQDFTTGLWDPYANKYLPPSQGRVQKKLNTHYLIAGVEIDGLSGKLIKRNAKPKVPHWVVVEQVEPVGRYYYNNNSAEGNGGWVTLYNPFMNRREEYSYKEFVNSLSVNDGGAGDGLWVSRDVRPVMREQNVLPSSGQFLTWTMRGVLDELARLLNKNPSDQITELAAVFGLSRKDIAIKLRDTFLNPVEKSLEVDRIADEISHWINTTSCEDPSFAIELALALRETGVLAIQQGNAGQKVGVIPQNQSPQIDPVISGSNPSEKVANFIGPIFASKASQEIKMQPG